MKLTKEILTEAFENADIFVVGWKSKLGEKGWGFYERGGALPVGTLLNSMQKLSVDKFDKALKELE